MKRLSLITLLLILITLPGYSQFWIEFGWHQSNCPQCNSMARTLRLDQRQAREYEKIIHKYGQRIEKESRRPYRQWDKAAHKIYDLRMDRDKKMLRLLDPYQFDHYIAVVRENPRRIHEYRAWYEHPSYGSVRIYPDVRRYENAYWSHHWKPTPKPQYKAPKQKDNKKHYDNRDYRSDRRDSRRPGRR